MLWIGSGRFDGRIGDGNGPRTCRGPDAGIGPSAWADGTVRQLAWGARGHYASSKSHIGCCGSGVAASMGESATAMGRGRAVGPMPASRPTGRSGLGYPLALEWRNLRLNCQWHTTTTASHCKGQRRCQYLSRCEAVTGPWISGHTDACIVRVGARRDRFSTIDKRGRRCLREPAHGLGEWPRAMARRGRAFAGP